MNTPSHIVVSLNSHLVYTLHYLITEKAICSLLTLWFGILKTYRAHNNGQGFTISAWICVLNLQTGIPLTRVE